MIKVFYKVPKIYDSQLKKLSEIAFPITDKNRNEEIEEFYTLDKEKFGRVIFITENKKVVGKISLYERTISLGNKNIKLGGIGGVCTDPEYRRRGVASSMLPFAISALRKKTCDVVFLCTDIKSSYKVKMYSDVGFELLPYGYNFLSKSNKLIARNDGFILSLGSQSIWKEIMRDPNPLFIGQGRW